MCASSNRGQKCRSELCGRVPPIQKGGSVGDSKVEDKCRRQKWRKGALWERVPPNQKGGTVVLIEVKILRIKNRKVDTQFMGGMYEDKSAGGSSVGGFLPSRREAQWETHPSHTLLFRSMVLVEPCT